MSADTASVIERVHTIAAYQDYEGLDDLSRYIGGAMAWTLVRPEMHDQLAVLQDSRVEDSLTGHVTHVLGEIAAGCADTRTRVLTGEDPADSAPDDADELPLATLGLGFGLVSDAIIERGLEECLSSEDTNLTVVNGYLMTAYQGFNDRREAVAAEIIASPAPASAAPRAVSVVKAMYTLMLLGPRTPEELRKSFGITDTRQLAALVNDLADNHDVRQTDTSLALPRSGELSLVPKARLEVLRSLLEL